MKTLRLVVVLSCLAASPFVSAAPETAPEPVFEVDSRWEPVGSDALRDILAVQRIDWNHWGLELYLWDVTDLDGRAQFRFALQLKPDHESAWTSVGYPRFRTDSDEWRDAVARGVIKRSRVVEASLDRSDHVFFSVVVPVTASAILIPVGEHTVRLETAAWIAGLTGDVPATPVSASPPPPRVAPALDPAPGQPARLSAAVRWSGAKPFGDGALDGGEQGELLVDVFNEGDRVARGVMIHITSDAASEVDHPAELPVLNIEPGGVETVPVPFSAGSGVSDDTVNLSIEVVEPYGHDAAPIAFELTTRAVALPVLVLTDDFALDGADLPIPRDRIVTMNLRIRNVGEGLARDVVADVVPGDGIYAAHDSASRFELTELAPGEIAELVYRCYANQRAERMALRIDIADSHSRSAPTSSTLTLPLESSDSTPRIVRVTPDPRSPVPPLAPPPPPLTSDVDRYVPEAKAGRPRGLAVVLGVESYVSAPPATYASSDARTAARYFEHALGVPPERIELLLDGEVTLAQMNRVFGKDGWLARRVHEDSEVFVFFAGHGVAESKIFDPYLMPSDGDLNYVRQTGLSLDWIVERLASLDADRVTVFLDACFSGLTREGGALLDGTRRLVVVPSYRGLSGVSLFSAARGAQSAHALDDQGHGLFSYYLFRGLGGAADLDEDRRVTTGELSHYLEEEVTRAAALTDREQTPAVFVDDEDHVLVPLP